MSLGKEDSYGRLDVLAYKASQRLVQELESYWNIPGIWDSVKGHVEAGIQDLRMKKVPEEFVDAIRKIAEAKTKG